MPAQQRDIPHTEPEDQSSPQLDAVIAQQVINTLGQPSDLRSVQVRRLWQGHYRVNVLAGADAASAKVAHSYFLVADRDGIIVDSTPKLTRRY
jgi:hypothetical protein